MPLLQGNELEDGRYLGLTVREVTALPHVDVFGFLSAMEAVLTQKGCSLSGGGVNRSAGTGGGTAPRAGTAGESAHELHKTALSFIAILQQMKGGALIYGLRRIQIRRTRRQSDPGGS